MNDFESRHRQAIEQLGVACQWAKDQNEAILRNAVSRPGDINSWWEDHRRGNEEAIQLMLADSFHYDGKETKVAKPKVTKRVQNRKHSKEESYYLTQKGREVVDALERDDLGCGLDPALWAMPEAVRPRTVCLDCQHWVEGYSDGQDLDLCGASILVWSPVTGLATYAECVDVNDGECPKWQAVPEVQQGTGSAEVKLYPDTQYPGPLLGGGLFPGPADDRPSVEELRGMFPQESDRSGLWMVGVAIVAAALVVGGGMAVWVAVANGWRP